MTTEPPNEVKEQAVVYADAFTSKLKQHLQDVWNTAYEGFLKAATEYDFLNSETMF